MDKHLEHIQKLLWDDTIPQLEGSLAEDPLFVQIHDELKTIREILAAFSEGDFSPAITAQGVIPGSLKTLQAHLQHMIRLLYLIEKEDFSHEIRLVGELSSAFNNMVSKLGQNLGELRRKEALLTSINSSLRSEVESLESLKESEARFKFLASHDPLTGILNRRSFIEMAEAGLANAAKLFTPCCVAMMDIDYFKRFNDTYGHVAGDEALRHVVKTIETGLRKKDFMGRYGGEEFVFFFNGTDEKSGFWVLERLRKKLMETPVVLESGPVSICASFGLVGAAAEAAGAAMERLSEDNYIQKLIDDADTALYAAKKAGRNRVMLYSSGQESSGQIIMPVIEETPETVESAVSDGETGLL